jgi:DinB family protein
MDMNRKLWNARQQKLRKALTAREYSKAIQHFFIQHAMVHSHEVGHANVYSFEEELWEGLTETMFRTILPHGEHSIAWILFHLARIEDMTMNLLVAGTPQLYTSGKWARKLKATISHSANRMDEASVIQLSQSVSMSALHEYRTEVGCGTREIVSRIKPDEFSQRVDPIRLQHVLEEGAVIPEAMEIINYWGGRTIAGLLLMPPTRHNFIHLNEALRIKQKLSH